MSFFVGLGRCCIQLTVELGRCCLQLTPVDRRPARTPDSAPDSARTANTSKRRRTHRSLALKPPLRPTAPVGTWQRTAPGPTAKQSAQAHKMQSRPAALRIQEGLLKCARWEHSSTHTKHSAALADPQSAHKLSAQVRSSERGCLPLSWQRAWLQVTPRRST